MSSIDTSTSSDTPPEYLAKIEALEGRIDALQRRVTSQEIVIQELCGIGVQWKRSAGRLDASEQAKTVYTHQELRTAVMSIAEELENKRKRSRYAVYGCLGAVAVLSGVIIRILYAQWQYSSTLINFHTALVDSGASLPPLDELSPSPLLLPASPVLSANEVATAPLWVILSGVRWILQQIVMAAASVVDRLLRAVVWAMLAALLGYSLLRRVRSGGEEDNAEPEEEQGPVESDKAAEVKSLERKVSEYTRQRTIDDSGRTLQRRMTDPPSVTSDRSINHGEELTGGTYVADNIKRRYTDPLKLQKPREDEALGNREIGQVEQDEGRRRRAALRYPIGWRPAAFRLQGCPWYGQGAWFCLSGAYHKAFSNIPCLFDKIVPKDLPKKEQRKLKENMWYTCWHTFTSCYGGYVLYHEKWFSFHRLFTDPVGMLFADPDISDRSIALERYYLVEISFWCSCLAFIMIETIRSDFYQMIFHHFVTISLMVGSFYLGYHRIGITVVFIHNISDVPLYFAKTLGYLADKYTWLKGPTNVAFAYFAISFYVMRLYVYPKTCVIPACTYACDYKRPLSDCILALLLVLLQCLHLLWASMIARMVYKTLRDHDVLAEGDIRSDDEGENTPASEKPIAHKRKVQ
ncbi:Ceramide synthase 6 [Perkinsus chesapeaki]|uniref:Ceramide synthase 6 n=1 Tax=Perkinsus chesapeaki TaxID=330153 RepID=A0A7J6KY10_PERCH|nr:Ceramide synthase 6 [Perkinsus chesapeaki]